MLRTLMGLIKAWHGTIELEGQDLTGLRTDRRVRCGMVYMSESAGFAELTVAEILRIGALFAQGARFAAFEELYQRFPALFERRRAPAGGLSGGQRKMLGIAKALAGNPKLLVMDEPSAGLSPLFVKEVIRLLAQLRARGLSLLIAEQNIKFLELADRVYTLDAGRIGFCGTVAAMHENDALRQAYFGLKARG
jgi:branched-chain amino acid transport system ATP-binding protein